MTRNIQSTGGNLTCTSDRESIEYTVELTRNNLDTGLKYLSDVATQQIFKPWELADKVKSVKGDLARVTPQIRAVDLLHRAAFYTELGNSIFCAKHHVGKISSETLQHYVAQNFTSARSAVVGVGIDHQLLVGFAKNLHLENGTTESAPSKYQGFGELRVDKAGNWAHVAIATQGGALSNQKEALAFAVLQQVAGAGPATKRGNSNGALGKVISGAVGDKPLGFSALNASYTDNGLFGFVISAEAATVGRVNLFFLKLIIHFILKIYIYWYSQAIEAGVKALKQGSVSNGDVARGKAQLKAAVLNELDNGSGLASDLGQQALLLGNVQSAASIISAIDGITDADVNAVSLLK